ncbi:hypothetical protein ACTI_63390 [Actinoplanes sp. OR16]|uniref:hypothetical protein n=1 Tax=Actinoplanes sp. OR16 TaxID=946334 RepID=UPI000F6B65AF|nr:hypothetical protein [Actinoplanes sp. OR16]BBH69654.1 hypothetical protein ACTI_63390 [Actinoplanes sp. OR16]
MSSTDTRTGAADPVRVLLLALAGVATAVGALRDLPALAVLGGLAGMLLLALAPQLRGRRLPRAGLALLAVVLIASYFPTLGDDGLMEQFVRSVVVAVCATAACALLFYGTGPGGGTALGGLLMALVVYGAVMTAVDHWQLMQELGEYMSNTVENEGADFGALHLLAAAALLVVGARRAPITRARPAV